MNEIELESLENEFGHEYMELLKANYFNINELPNAYK
jgi:hypothetical protein